MTFRERCVKCVENKGELMTLFLRVKIRADRNIYYDWFGLKDESWLNSVVIVERKNSTFAAVSFLLIYLALSCTVKMSVCLSRFRLSVIS